MTHTVQNANGSLVNIFKGIMDMSLMRHFAYLDTSPTGSSYGCRIYTVISITLFLLYVVKLCSSV